jgi:hypothetical protein
MRSSVAMLVAAVALIVLSTASGSRSAAPLPRSALVPNAVAFRGDGRYGIVGTGREYCAHGAGHCRLQGTISQTTDGGKTWHIVRRTSSPVIYAAWFHDLFYVQLLNGRTLQGKGRDWERNPGHLFGAYCPGWYTRGVTADIVDTNEVRPWSLCLGQGGAGNEAKGVYRGTKRVAYTPMTGGHAPGQIGSYGYPQGIAGGYSGFGIIWESRGTLYVTHDGGRHWYPQPKVARPEIDFGQWADVAWRKLGFVLLERNQHSRLIETRDAGRTWRVVHRWR